MIAKVKEIKKKKPVQISHDCAAENGRRRQNF